MLKQMKYFQALEQDLGVSLLERRNRKFTVAPAGAHFYKKSLILTADFDKLCRETAQIACGKDARICVGYLKRYSGREFHQAVAGFTEKYPDVTIQIINGNHEV